jgi:hypothetical protein
MRLDLLEGVRTLQWSGLHSSPHPASRTPSINSTTRQAHRRGVGADGRPGSMSLDDAGRLRTSTDARHDLQGKRCLLRH